MTTLDPAPLIEAALGGQPRHQNADCPYCHGRTTRSERPELPYDGHFGLPAGELSAQCMTTEEIAERVGVSRRTIDRWVAGEPIRVGSLESRNRGLGLVKIDRLATNVGRHFEELWPELAKECA